MHIPTRDPQVIVKPTFKDDKWMIMTRHDGLFAYYKEGVSRSDPKDFSVYNTKKSAVSHAMTIAAEMRAWMILQDKNGKQKIMASRIKTVIRRTPPLDE